MLEGTMGAVSYALDLSSRAADVYFERSTTKFSTDAVARSTAAKLKLESYYKMAVDSAIERNARSVNSCLP